MAKNVGKKAAAAVPEDRKPTNILAKKRKAEQPVKAKAVEVVPVAEEDEDEDEDDEDYEDVEDNEDDSDDDSEDEDDVNEEGMAKLMAALGEDGLDDFAQAELRALAGDDDDSEGDEGDEEGDEDEEGQEEVSEDEDDVVDGGEEEEEEEEEDLALDEVESVEEDAVPRQKLEIDNKIALERIRDTIKLHPSMSWTETLTVTYPETIDVDVDDDLNRELAFYKQALHGATTAKSLAAKHNFPFTRPTDYFAEMVKSDAHMERIRQRLLDESATIKKSEDKRKEREGKKFGKQVQMEKLKERERSKKDMDDRLKGLKRKRKGALDGAGDEDFDVAVEDAISERPSKRTRGGSDGGRRGISRNARDKKFGFGGGADKRSKQNTRDSTDDFGGRGGSGARGGRGRGRGGARGGRGGARGARGGAKPNRPGKGRREKARG
ncbi:rRNA-processing protein and EBNA1-binding protein ebp2 [Steccherinum ochraceum]|uniref:rRNA-processing protein and EBNA1-binding protein ebp2 n=1 Tax=Steccherinum ochraceum TaxID=92696 RepID=A0A4R0RQ85_9APHY|nr:rRNA-processing protein and EBNA1-binding protein ebp2 [Steccherinum ochraceum]